MVGPQPHDPRNHFSESEAARSYRLAVDKRLKAWAKLRSKFHASRSDDEWREFEEWDSNDKVATRLRMVEAFRELDELRERAASRRNG